MIVGASKLSLREVSVGVEGLGALTFLEEEVLVELFQETLLEAGCDMRPEWEFTDTSLSERLRSGLLTRSILARM